MLVQGGMTPHEALRAATLDGARYLGLDRDLGSIEPGKLADLVVIDGDPLVDIRDSDRVRHVMLNGRLYDALTMNEIGRDTAAAPAVLLRACRLRLRTFLARCCFGSRRLQRQPALGQRLDEALVEARVEQVEAAAVLLERGRQAAGRAPGRAAARRR